MSVNAEHSLAAGVWVNEPRLPGPVATVREVWLYRRFVGYLGYRSVKKQYARTRLGWSWLFIAPLFPLLIRVLVFGGLIGLTATGVPYFLFLLIGTMAWDLFVTALMWGTRGLEMNRSVLRRVYVPRVILPVATMMPAFMNLGLKSGILAGGVAFYWFRDGTTYLSLGLHTLWSLASLLLVVVLAFGIGMFTSVWGEAARDARFTLAQVTSVWMLLTPILYSAADVPEASRHWLYANPMAAYVEAFKYGLLGIEPPDLERFAVAAIVSVLIAVAGMLFFTRREDAAAELGS